MNIWGWKMNVRVLKEKCDVLWLRGRVWEDEGVLCADCCFVGFGVLVVVASFLRLLSSKRGVILPAFFSVLVLALQTGSYPTISY